MFIAAFFAGHFHEGLRVWSDTCAPAPLGIHEIVLPSNCWNSKRADLDKAPGYSPMEFRPGYVLAEFSSRSIVLSYRPLGQAVAAVKQLQLA